MRMHNAMIYNHAYIADPVQDRSLGVETAVRLTLRSGRGWLVAGRGRAMESGAATVENLEKPAEHVGYEHVGYEEWSLELGAFSCPLKGSQAWLASVDRPGLRPGAALPRAARPGLRPRAALPRAAWLGLRPCAALPRAAAPGQDQR